MKKKGLAPATIRRLHAVITRIAEYRGDVQVAPDERLDRAEHGVAPTPENVLGVLSLIVWSLIIIISVKYLALVMRADNDGDVDAIDLV